MESHTFELKSVHKEAVDNDDDNNNNNGNPSSPSNKPKRHERLVWTVHVRRHGVSEPVGVLHVTADCLPPRMRKNKVVWKLPETMDTLPKFGEHERKRLWELFKAQKKERRKKGKGDANTNNPTGGGGDGDGGGDCSNTKNDGGGTREDLDESQTCLDDQDGDDNVNVEAISPGGQGSMTAAEGVSSDVTATAEPQKKTNGCCLSSPVTSWSNIAQSSTFKDRPKQKETAAAVPTSPSQSLSINTSTRPTQPSLPPPPPGFAAEQLPFTKNNVSLTPPSSSLYSSTLAPSSLMDGLTLQDQQGTPSVKPPLAAPLPPPPPGISIPSRSSPSFSNRDEVTTTLSSPLLSSTSPTATAPAAATKQHLPRNGHAATTTTTATTTADDSSSLATLDPFRLKIPPRYFVVPEQPKLPTDLVVALGTLVTSAFLQLIPTGQVTEWLAHYAPSSYCSLLMGSAQVARLTSLSDKWQEWNSLSSTTTSALSSGLHHPAPSWECHGWTGQPITTTTLQTPPSDCNGTAISHGGGNSTHHPHPDQPSTNNNDGVLLVLTGRTIQKTERLAFTLTLLLRPASSSDTLRAYQIENDILSLTPLDPPLASSPSSPPKTQLR